MKKILLAILLLPSLLSAQSRLHIITSMQQPPSGPSIIISTTSASFTGQAGVATTPIAITYNFLNTTAASNSITLPSFIEGSLDAGSTWHTGFSSLNNCLSCTILIRVTAATTVGSYGPSNATFQSTTGGTTAQNCAITALMGSIAASPSSITGLNGTTGSAGTPQTVTVTFLSTTVTATPPVGTEISKNGGTSYATSQTLSSGSPLGVLIRTQASASAGAFSGNLALSATGITTVNVSISGTISGAAPKDSMRVQHYITPADTVAGWSHVFGDPSTGLRSVVGGNNGTITYSTLNTSFWGQSGGACIGTNNGLPSTTTWPYATGVMKEGVLNTNAMDTTKHMAQFSGLIPGATYKVALSGVTQYNFNFAARYNVGGATWGTFQTLNCNGVSNPNPLQLTWTVVANSSGIIYIAMGADPGTAGSIAGLMNAITITQQ